VELRHFQHFVAVAEAGSFTRAAGQVHIVQSGLSASIQSLERELGAPLFHRTGRTVELTDAGTALLAEARKVLAAVDAARDAVAAVEGGLRGTVRVGIMHAMALPELAGVLAAFSQERPQVQVVPRNEAGGSADLVRALLHDHLDVAFTALPPDRYPDELSITPLRSEELLLALPPNHRLIGSSTVQLSELEGETFIEYPSGWGIRQGIDALFASERLSRRSVLEVADIPTVLDLVCSGRGAAFVIPATATGTGRPPLVRVTPSPRFEVVLARPAASPPRPATAAFVEAVGRHFSAAGSGNCAPGG
jgi:DNA-binding transcriptional LysR family regulator